MYKQSEDNPWPGFVDVLSSTLLVFVFLVIVELLVIAGISMKVSQTVAQKMVEKKQQDLLDQLSKVEPDIIQQDELPLKKNTPPDIISEVQLKIIYKDLSTLLESDGSARIDAWVDEKKEDLLLKEIQINAFLGHKDLSLTTSSFVSFNRVMDIRARLVAKGIPAKNITVRVYNTKNTDQNEVIIWTVE